MAENTFNRLDRKTSLQQVSIDVATSGILAEGNLTTAGNQLHFILV